MIWQDGCLPQIPRAGHQQVNLIVQDFNEAAVNREGHAPGAGLRLGHRLLVGVEVSVVTATRLQGYFSGGQGRHQRCVIVQQLKRAFYTGKRNTADLSGKNGAVGG